jgi:aryl-alcohol dehydrogenase-like predicted oxidoreductase
MEERAFGRLGTVSALTLGGGGLGQIWGATTREEAVATVRAALDGGIRLLDLAPSYGDGEAELVVGEALGGRLPDGVRVTTKCLLGAPPAGDVYSDLHASLTASLERMRLPRVDLFVLHGQIVPDGWRPPPPPAAANTTTPVADVRRAGTPRSLFVQAVRPAFERLRDEGLIGDWAITGIGVPSAIIETLEDAPRPAAVQCITNLLDSPGGLARYDEPPRPREIAAAAVRAGVAVMGIRAVQAGALTDGIDRELPEGHSERRDFERAAPFRAIARELGESAAAAAHRYALSMEGVSTVVLGVKNRVELADCLAAEARGPLEPSVIARIDGAVGRA